MTVGSQIPISKTNVQTIIGAESAWGTIATKGHLIAYDSNAFARQQTLEKNVELRGIREMGTRIPGQKNPGGALTGHQTDQTLVMDLEAMLGFRTSTVKLQTAPTAALVLVAGLVDAGTHSYKKAITRPNGIAVSGVSNTVTNDGTHQKNNVTIPTLPTGWTTALYRSAAGNAVTGPWLGVPGATALASTVTVFLDNVADSSLTGAFPTATDNDWTHVMTISNVLQSYTVERSLPYTADPTEYFVGLGAKMNKGSITAKGPGFFDITADWLCGSFTNNGTTSFDSTPDDWRFGEKLHHAMIASGDVKIAPAGGSFTAFAKFLEMKFDHMNNLDTTDYPVSYQGNRGSLVELQAETQFSGNIKVTDPDVLSFIQDQSLHDLTILWEFATPGHTAFLEAFGIQFDPTDPVITGQGITLIPFNGFASQPSGGTQYRWTVVNDVPGTSYDAT